MDINKQNAPEYEIDDSELEAEGFPEEPQMDTVYVLDGRGRLVSLEVPDDA